MLTNREMTTGRDGGARGAGGGFTLLELLVVVAAIAVLLLILAPSLIRVGQSGRLAVCKTRLHNIGRGLAQYAAVADTRFPVSDYVNSTHKGLIDALHESNCVVNPENYYCPGETDASRMYSRENVDAGRIGYFYYSCRWPTFDVNVSGSLRYDVSWPRELTSESRSNMWVASDCWFRGRKSTHPSFPKGVNYLTVNGDVSMVESSPGQAFK